MVLSTVLLTCFASSAHQATVGALEENVRVLLPLEDTFAVDMVRLDVQTPRLRVEHGWASLVGASELPLRNLVILLDQSVWILSPREDLRAMVLHLGFGLAASF